MLLTDDATVYVGKSICLVTSINDNQIECTLNSNGAGVYPFADQIGSQGNSNQDMLFRLNSQA